MFLARVRALLRQHEQSVDEKLSIGQYAFQPSQKLLVRNEDGDKIRLTEKETTIPKYLYRSKRWFITRETLPAEVWGHNLRVATHTLLAELWAASLSDQVEELIILQRTWREVVACWRNLILNQLAVY